MFHVCVKKTDRKRICVAGQIWVKDDSYQYYVSKQARGAWKTREEAEQMITKKWEMVVEEHE